MRLDQVTLSAQNLAESIAFYRKLGLRGAILPGILLVRVRRS